MIDLKNIDMSRSLSKNTEIVKDKDNIVEIDKKLKKIQKAKQELYFMKTSLNYSKTGINDLSNNILCAVDLKDVISENVNNNYILKVAEKVNDFIYNYSKDMYYDDVYANGDKNILKEDYIKNIYNDIVYNNAEEVIISVENINHQLNRLNELEDNGYTLTFDEYMWSRLYNGHYLDESFKENFNNKINNEMNNLKNKYDLDTLDYKNSIVDIYERLYKCQNFDVSKLDNRLHFHIDMADSVTIETYDNIDKDGYLNYSKGQIDNYWKKMYNKVVNIHDDKMDNNHETQNDLNRDHSVLSEKSTIEPIQMTFADYNDLDFEI